MKVLHYQDSNNNGWAILCGMVGGSAKFLAQIHSSSFMTNFFGSLLTALMCGAAGVAGKELYLYIKKVVKTKKEQ